MARHVAGLVLVFFLVSTLPLKYLVRLSTHRSAWRRSQAHPSKHSGDLVMLARALRVRSAERCAASRHLPGYVRVCE
jgi:transcriptional regulator of nitric oxide reductase